MSGRLGRARRAYDVVVGKGDRGVVLRIERYLEEVSQVAVCSTTQSTG
jgi:hypothetical protein